jgi:hypothetical protein
MLPSDRGARLEPPGPLNSVLACRW